METDNSTTRYRRGSPSADREHDEAQSGALHAGRRGFILVIDCFGLLSGIYRYGTVAYVGGGFGVGIHNLPEAAVWSVPVFFGPNNGRFQEAQALKSCGGGIEIHSHYDFAARMDSLAAVPGEMRRRGKLAGGYIASHAGATKKILGSVKL